MEELGGQDLGIGSSEMRGLRQRMDELLYCEELMWLQRSCINWLKEGDQNTKYFHRKAAGRAKKNTIKLLRKHDGQTTKDRMEIEIMATKIFKELYTANPEVNPNQLAELFEAKITEEMNGELCKVFTEEEINNAMFQIGSLKASGPDGFPAQFFQRNWEVLRGDIIKVVQGFFETRKMPHGVNEMAILLLPKKDAPEYLKDYRPISLCNIIYKVVFKCMVNQMHPLLNDIIAPMQSAFMLRWFITYNALIAFQCLHALSHGQNSCKSFGALKLDLTKAYDRVDWKYLEQVLT
jgi:hypothetical protein